MTPQTIGRYQIKANLGRGGMATVYRAYDPRFRRDVALKMMLREFLGDPTFRARFLREAQTIAQLEHSAIVPVYDFGEHEGQPYLVMRYFSGGSLSDRVERGSLPLDEVAAILERIGAALDNAHAVGLIHRDVKPANVLFDQYGDAFLSDFGIVKLAEATVQLTGSGIVGTPAYMAPEVSTPEGLSPLVDVYALGVTLFEMLTGRLPFLAQTPIGVLMAHIDQPVPIASRLRPGLPAGVQPVIERAMAKSPPDRFQSAGALTAAYKAALAGKPVPAAPVPRTAYAAARPIPVLARRKRKARPLFRLLPVVAVVSVMALLCGIAVWLVSGAWGRLFANSSAVSYPVPDTEALQLAWMGVSANSEWAPVMQAFDGVEMALVPAGCFTMGSESGFDDEKPVHRQCFEEPFWIDVYEVTNGQYGASGTWGGDDRPREEVSWFEAVEYCQERGERLPTEAEWEYAARGPDGLVYPWGDDFAGSSVVYKNNALMQTASVGSRPGGASWVGALDMSGNLWEWTSSIYDAYPYRADDGREASGSEDDRSERALRGGSWFNPPERLTTASRIWGGPGDANKYFGFRCARSYGE